MNLWPGTFIGQRVRAKVDILDKDGQGNVYFHAHIGDEGVIHHIDNGKHEFFPTIEWTHSDGKTYFDCTPDDVELIS